MRYDAKDKLKAVREVLAGAPIATVASKYGISRQSLWSWLSRYKQSPRLASLSHKYRKGRNHHRRLAWRCQKAILEVVVKHPNFGVSKIVKKLAGEGIGISTFGVWRVLAAKNLQVRELRVSFSVARGAKTVLAHKIGTGERIRAVELYLVGGRPISEICRIFSITRKTFYSWIERYQAKGEDKFAALARKYRRGYAHPRCKTGNIREKILEIIAAHPAYSVHKLHAYVNQLQGTLGQAVTVTHQALQNLLSREGLSTLVKRFLFAKQSAPEPEVFVAPLYKPEMPVWKLRMILAPFSSIPKLLVTNPRAGLLRLVTVAIGLFIVVLWARMLVATTGVSPIGLMLASVALLFGLFFFIYSLKYYTSIVMILRLAQGGMGSGTGDPSTDSTSSLQASSGQATQLTTDI